MRGKILRGRRQVAWFAWSVGATLSAACQTVDRPPKVIEAIAPANKDTQRDAGAVPPMEPAASSDNRTSEETLPVVGGIESSNDATDPAAAGCAGDAGTCSPLPICAGDAGSCEDTCPGCFVDGSCVAPAAVNPENPCLICAPGRDPRAWSNNDGATCDDGLFCTVDDACEAGACEGAPRNCDDGVACNGVSTCLEDSDSCSAPVSQCGANAVCDVATDTCKSTCDGCVIGGVCVLTGAEAAGNPCQVCDPMRATTGYSVAAGKSCGAAATACSGQDTCDAQGRCQPNNLPVNTPCGNSNSSACDQADACDGNGNCQQRLASNGTPCDDGAFCTTGDQCQGGQCVASGQQNCGANRVCNESTNQCQCQGCQVGNNCFTAGAMNPSNGCQVCDPNRSSTAFSANAGAVCGAGPGACSGQDTCDVQGRCQANDSPNGVTCTSATGTGTCQAGQCASAKALGDPCQTSADCANGAECTAFYPDGDGDSYAPAGATASSFCANVNFTKTNFTRVRPTSRQTTDCLDSNRDVHPGQSAFFIQPAGTSYDYNCDGAEEKVARTVVTDDVCFADGDDGSCTATGIADDTPCGETMVTGSCIPQGPSSCRLFVGDSIGTRGCR